MTKKMKINTQFQKYEDKINNGFTRVKILINTHEQVANSTHFSKELLKSKMSKLNYLPIIAEFKEENNDFGTHGGKLELSDEGIEFIKTTRPYGVVIADSGKFETITKPNGDKCEYVTCLAYVWSKMYPELNVLFEGKSNNQSMEIDILDGYYTEDNVFEITDFEYNALCILGKDITPAFNEAKIEANFAKLDFKTQYTQMIDELKQYLKDDKEDDDMSKENEKKTSENEEIIKDTNIENQETNQENEDGTKQEDVKDKNVKEENEDYNKKIIELTEKCLSYQEVIDKYKEMEKEYKKLKTFKEKIDTQEKKEKIDNLFAKVEKYMDDDIKDLKEKAIDMDYDKLEKSLYSLVGQKILDRKDFSLQEQEMDTVNMGVDKQTNNKTTGKPYDSILEKYINN